MATGVYKAPRAPYWELRKCGQLIEKLGSLSLGS